MLATIQWTIKNLERAKLQDGINQELTINEILRVLREEVNMIKEREVINTN